MHTVASDSQEGKRIQTGVIAFYGYLKSGNRRFGYAWSKEKNLYIKNAIKTSHPKTGYSLN
jgi:hypothetical protein